MWQRSRTYDQAWRLPWEESLCSQGQKQKNSARLPATLPQVVGYGSVVQRMVPPMLHP